MSRYICVHKPQYREQIIAYSMLLGIEVEHAGSSVGWCARYTRKDGTGGRTMSYPDRAMAAEWALSHLGWRITDDGELYRHA